MIPDLFNFMLTSNISNEYTMVSNSLMINWESKNWDSKIIGAAGLPENIFSDIAMPCSKLGLLHADLCKELNVKPINIIAAASHDTASAFIGIPVAEKDKKWAFISTGTWCVLGCETKKPIMKEEILEHTFTNESSAEGTNFLARDINGLWIIQQCRKKWLSDHANNISWEYIIQKANEAEPFKAFIDIDDPNFLKPHEDMPKVIKEYCRINNQRIPNSLSEIARCIFESLTLKFNYFLKLLEKITEEKFDYIHLIGGGSKNSILCQWTANVTGLRVYAGPPETASTGNLLVQLKGNGEIKDLEEGRDIALKSTGFDYFEPKEVDIWKEAFNKYLTIYKK